MDNKNRPIHSILQLLKERWLTVVLLVILLVLLVLSRRVQTQGPKRALAMILLLLPIKRRASLQVLRGETPSSL
ncbi:Methionine ABC transporter ATP-binding protein [Clostridiaceae bacterium JG1575]|nr:Methionine ABC transporter ATP-binding protein [Clostridiaceae bacterium JG1575]